MRGEGMGQRGPVASVTLSSFWLLFFLLEIIIFLSLNPGARNPSADLFTPPTRLRTDPGFLPLNSCWVLNYFTNTLIIFFLSFLHFPFPPFPNPATKYSTTEMLTGYRQNPVAFLEVSLSIPVLRVRIPSHTFLAQDETAERLLAAQLRHDPLLHLWAALGDNSHSPVLQNQL